MSESVEDYKSKYHYALAEIENMRKRKHKELEAASDRATAEALLALLPIVDDIERAVAAAQAGSPGDNGAGLKAIMYKARATLAGLDVHTFETVGRPFAAELMDAIVTVPVKTLTPGDVAVEISPGYKIGTRLLRPAQVGVAAED